MPPGCAGARADALAALYTSDGVFIRDNLPAAAGTEAVRAAYRQVFATLKLDVAFEIKETEVVGDMAWLRATSKGRIKTPGKRRRGDGVVQRRRHLPAHADGLEDPLLYVRLQARERARRSKTMSDERYTVILGDRRYAIHRKWARLPAGESFGFLSDLMVDGEGRVHVAQRGTDRPVLVFDRDGRLAGAWGEGVLAEPHYINAAPDGSILVADRDAHQVLRFDAAGKLLQALGKRHWPSLDAPFNHPTAAAQAADGEIYVADGYGNSSVHRFAADGTLIATWGGPGAGPGAFTTPHAIWVDRFGKVLVGDRENNRVQVFDRAGAFLAEWGDFYHPMQIWVDDRDLVFVTDQIPRISLLSADGKLIGRCRGAINGAHGISGDAQGNLYLAELPPQEITKLERLDA